jgi:hypothetical protein
MDPDLEKSFVSLLIRTHNIEHKSVAASMGTTGCKLALEMHRRLFILFEFWPCILNYFLFFTQDFYDKYEAYMTVMHERKERTLR